MTHSLYSVWANMIGRCHNSDDPSYKYYGERGIVVCESWRRSFDQFVKDMGLRPPRYQIDRYPNPDGNYEPTNTRWASRVDNNRNKRATAHRFIEFGGKRQLLVEWAEETGIPRETIYGRLQRGWSVERALTEPKTNKMPWLQRSGRRTARTRIIVVGKRRLNLREWAKRTGVHPHTINDRLSRGWSERDAVLTPLQRTYT